MFLREREREKSERSIIRIFRVKVSLAGVKLALRMVVAKLQKGMIR